MNGLARRFEVSSFCLGCGNSLAEGERFCGACGRDSLAGANVAPVDPQVAFGLPPETSGKAIFSLICGILFIILPFSVVAVIFGHIAVSEIRKNPGRLKGRGLAITGIALGYVGVVLLVGFFGLVIYQIGKTERQITNAVRSSSESSVVASLRKLNTAEIAYGQGHREVGYTCSLAELSGVWGISSDLAAGKKNGYIFELRNCRPSKPGGPIAKYQLIAYSVAASRSEAPAYCSDESAVVRVVRKGSPEDCFDLGSELPVKEVNNPQNR
jgi:hypothetical protein